MWSPERGALESETFDIPAYSSHLSNGRISGEFPHRYITMHWPRHSLGDAAIEAWAAELLVRR